MADKHVSFRAVGGNLSTPDPRWEEQWNPPRGSRNGFLPPNATDEERPVNPSPESQPESARQAQKPGERRSVRERTSGLLNSQEPCDLLSKSHEILTFLTASFANDWDSSMSQGEINGLYWILDSVNDALRYAIEGMECEG